MYRLRLNRCVQAYLPGFGPHSDKIKTLTASLTEWRFQQVSRRFSQSGADDIESRSMPEQLRPKGCDDA